MISSSPETFVALFLLPQATSEKNAGRLNGVSGRASKEQIIMLPKGYDRSAQKFLKGSLFIKAAPGA